MTMMLQNANAQPKITYIQPCFTVSEFARGSIVSGFYTFADWFFTGRGIGKYFNKQRIFSEAISPEKSKLRTKSASSGGKVK